MNANTFFNNRAGVKRPAFSQNQYGANAGGPIIRDKTFFFGSWEGFRLRQGASYVYTVPTDAMRTGDFSNVRNAAGDTDSDLRSAIHVRPPWQCRLRRGMRTETKSSRAQPFSGNVIPNSRIDPASKILANYWGRANTAGNQFTAVNNYTANASVGGDNDQYNARVDHTFSEANRFFARYTYWKNLNLPIDPYKTQTCVDRCTETFNTNQGVIGDTHSFSPTLILDYRLSFTRFHYDRTSLTAGYDLTQLGWPASLNNQVIFRVVPQPLVTGYNGVWSTNGTGSTIIARNDIFSIAPNLTKIWGRHTLKFGAEIRRLTHNYYQQNSPSGTFNFDALMTSANPFAAAGTGNGFASFLLGYGTGGGVTNNALVAGQMLYRAYYAGDQWQVTPRITFNYGLRYEQMGPWSERFDRMIVLLPNATNDIPRTGGINVKGRFGLVNSADSPSRNNTKLGNLFSPRVGLALPHEQQDRVPRRIRDLLAVERHCVWLRAERRSGQRLHYPVPGNHGRVADSAGYVAQPVPQRANASARPERQRPAALLGTGHHGAGLRRTARLRAAMEHRYPARAVRAGWRSRWRMPVQREPICPARASNSTNSRLSSCRRAAGSSSRWRTPSSAL